MEISAVTSSPNPVNSIFATTSTQRVAFSIVTPVATSSTSVDISALGQLLSATSILNQTLAASDSTASFGTVVAVTQQLVDAFNTFLQSQQTTSGISIGSLFEQMLSASGTTGAGESILSSLSGVGVNFQAATSQDVPAQMTIDFQQLQAAYTTDQAGTVATLLAVSQSIGQFAAQLAGAVAQADMLTQLGTLQAEAINAAGAVSSSAGTNTTVFGAAVSSKAGTEASGTTASGTTASGTTASGTTASGTTASGTTVSGTTVSGTTVSGTTASGTTASGTTASGTTVSGTTVSGTTASGTTASGTTVSATTVSGTAGTVIGTPISGTPGATVSASVEAGPPVLSAAVPGTVATATSATIDTALTAGVTAVPVALTLPTLAESSGLLLNPSIALPATQNAVIQASVANIARSSTLINPLIDSSNPAIAAAIAAYHMVDGIFDTTWPHDGGAPPPINFSEIRAIAGIGRIKLDLTA
ncbi:MAG: hypothetical protein WCK93_00460 [Nitrosomonadales bacterium]